MASRVPLYNNRISTYNNSTKAATIYRSDVSSRALGNWTTSSGTSIGTSSVVGKWTGSNGWDTRCYVSAVTASNVSTILKMKFNVGTGYWGCLGLNSDPGVGTYANLDYCWFSNTGNGWSALKGGVGGIFDVTPGSPNDVAEIKYDGVNVTFWMNGICGHTASRPVGSTLYVDSAIYGVGSYFNSVELIQ